MPFGLQPLHLVIIFVVALLIFGPRRLPEIGRGIGKAINEFRKGTQEMTENLREEVTRPAQEAHATAGAAPSNSMAPNAMPPQSAPAQSAPVQSAAVPAAPVQTAAGNFCSQCGSPNPAEARFCSRCGSPLPA